MKERCTEVLERAYLFLDGEGLSEDERVEIETHLEECAPCLERYGLEREVTHLLARLKSSSPCPDRVKSRILSLLEEV
ncbi:MAG: mycothiol system anti-sigma-R factor [Actinomycetota bacterium]